MPKYDAVNFVNEYGDVFVPGDRVVATTCGYGNGRTFAGVYEGQYRNRRSNSYRKNPLAVLEIIRVRDQVHKVTGMPYDWRRAQKELYESIDLQSLGYNERVAATQSFYDKYREDYEYVDREPVFRMSRLVLNRIQHLKDFTRIANT